MCLAPRNQKKKGLDLDCEGQELDLSDYMWAAPTTAEGWRPLRATIYRNMYMASVSRLCRIPCLKRAIEARQINAIQQGCRDRCVLNRTHQHQGKNHFSIRKLSGFCGKTSFESLIELGCIKQKERCGYKSCVTWLSYTLEIYTPMSVDDRSSRPVQ
jgi:hypothetical protein